MTAAADMPLRGVIIDPRDNEGGLFDAAIGEADLLLNAGEIGVQRGRGPGVTQRHVAREGDVLGGTALRVLVNGRTAAGAESSPARCSVTAAHRLWAAAPMGGAPCKPCCWSATPAPCG